MKTGGFWNLRGMQTNIMGLISSLFTISESAVKCGGNTSHPSLSPLSSGVRQDCVIAPTLFFHGLDIYAVRHWIHCWNCHSFWISQDSSADSWCSHKWSEAFMFGVLLDQDHNPGFWGSPRKPTQSKSARGIDNEVAQNFTYLVSAVHDLELSDQ